MGDERFGKMSWEDSVSFILGSPLSTPAGHNRPRIGVLPCKQRVMPCHQYIHLSRNRMGGDDFDSQDIRITKHEATKRFWVPGSWLSNTFAAHIIPFQEYSHSIQKFVCIYIYVYIYISVCIYIYLFIYGFIHVYKFWNGLWKLKPRRRTATAWPGSLLNGSVQLRTAQAESTWCIIFIYDYI